jgi:glycosyltransferase involved in cell wall biosynthesis
VGPECFVSVVVPTYNRAASLGRLLQALAEQTYPAHAFEVIVVDDGSADGTLGRLREWSFPFALRILQQEHGGPAQARNLGVRHATGDLIVFVDDDVVPVPELLDEHVRSHGLGSDLVVVGPMSPPRDWRRPAWVRWEEDMLQVQYRDMLAGKYPCTPRQFYTANVSLPRARFVQAHGFDATFKRAEDVELAYRLRDLGMRFVFNPRAEVRHYASRSLSAWLRTPYQYGRYDVIMARDKGQETLQCATYEFHERNWLTRTMTRVCVGRPMLFGPSVQVMRIAVQAADRLSVPPRIAGMLLSGLFNVMYWQGACDELGGRGALMDTLAEGARLEEKPRLVAGEAPVVLGR